MCKAAALTKTHPVRRGDQDCSSPASRRYGDPGGQRPITSSAAERFIFGFGSGFPRRDVLRRARLELRGSSCAPEESLELIRKCWSSDEPFDWDGKYWKGKGITALPRPYAGSTMPMATATDQPEMLKLAGEQRLDACSPPFSNRPDRCA